MKKILAIATILAALCLTASAQTTNINILSLPDTATNIVVIPFAKYDLSSHEFGYGAAALYKVTDKFWTGIRADHINGYNSTAGVQAQIQQPISFVGLKGSVFLETSVGLGSSSLYGAAGPGAYFKLFGHTWARSGQAPVTLNVALIADYEHVVQNSTVNKSSNQVNGGPLLNLNF